ncbi:peptidyl-tRNA hydrolase [Alicyclobacillus cellulosilyticus]|uniref:Peptidyl-tRNA hydrolase n=1 Tax=Alicyclobacillus cellulosilyticus TaxID=1003997 RepID=A0A917KF44_9BACL|nr:aminoacyl-tRNA hydrolase [Alicyclobacillus cellulosilyticus]GGJ08844.1 peptidyl-tRNA hydrolase [Alicyclobacillus cellulosilyticus]
MKVIVGLGNPGPEYAQTRHNVGFWVVDRLADRWQAGAGKEKWRAWVAEVRCGAEKVLLVKPLTYMNQSGESVRAVINFYRDLDITRDLIVVYDDMDFAPGEIRLRQKGSAGGHNGMKSVIAHLGSEVFPRVRVGIGRPGPGADVVSYVLSPFPPQERLRVEAAAERAANAIEFAVQHTFELAMNRFNRPPEACGG